MKKKVSEVMSTDVEVVSPNCSVQDAARKMRELDVGSLPVCNDERLLGMVTDRDIVTRILSSDEDTRDAPVQSAMSSPIVYCFEDQDIEDAVRIMETRQIRRLVVLNGQKKLVGIVSLGDIALRMGNETLAGEVMERISEPTRKQQPTIHQ